VPLTLYIHPLASFCHKVLIALYETGQPFRSEIVDLGDPGSAAVLLSKWPVGKIPVLHDEERGQTVPETTIIIEYLQRHYPSVIKLLPDDPDTQLETRLWDRFFDLYVSVPMQKIVTDRLRPAGNNDEIGVRDARSALAVAYGMIEQHMATRQWAMGDAFTLADCSAAPALFFAAIVQPFEPQQHKLRDYLERLLARPSAARAIDEARPYFSMFPYKDAMPDRFLVSETT
jgi:glutathione S-transferase